MPIRAKEELVIVQIVSSSRQTFVLQKGLKDGYAKGMEIIFGNENTSIVCKAIEVSREYSLWKPVDQNANIPFNKFDVITLNSHVFGNIAVDVGNGKDNINVVLGETPVYSKIRTQNDFSFRYSYGAAISQSSSSVSTSQNSKKINEEFDLEYGHRFRPEIEFSLGGRLNYAIYRLTNPILDIASSRTFLMGSFVYHFVNFSKNENNIYAAITFGIGKSSTDVNNSTSSGLAYIFPQIRIGYLVPFTKTVAMVGEFSLESVHTREAFPGGATQNNSDVNAEFSLGLRF